MLQTAPLIPPRITPPANPLPAWRFYPTFVRNPLRAIPQSVYEQPMVVYTAGGAAAVWVTDPKLVETVLLHEHDTFPKTPIERRIFKPTLGDGILTSEAASWRWQRRTAAPLFRHQDVQGYVPAMAAAADRQIARWRAAGPAATHAIDRDMTATTFDVISATIFDGATREEAQILQTESNRYLERISWEIVAAMLNVPEWVWHPAKGQMRVAARRLDATVRTILARARESDGGSGLIARLVAARDPESGAPMSDAQIADNIQTFAAAGHETTAKALTWTLYLLARAPQWQERVRREVLAIAGHETISAAHIDALVETRKVLREAMRLYPPAPVLTRITREGVVLGGHQLGPDVLIVIPIYAIHRHTKWWSDPDVFDPERFSAEREKALVRTQYMPFGFGQRMCIGMSFAMIEATVLLASLVRAARFEWDGVHMPEPLSRVTLRPKGGMPLGVTIIA